MCTLRKTLLHAPRLRRQWGWVWAALTLSVGVAALTPGDLALTATASDKLDHLLGFAALSTTAALALAPGRRSITLAGGSMLAYGVLIELLQTQVPGRSGDLQDALADSVGVALGLVMVSGLRRLFPAPLPVH